MSGDVTVEELKERIVERFDVLDLLDHLEITIEELVEAFSDKIEEHYEQLVPELFDEFGEDEEAY